MYKQLDQLLADLSHITIFAREICKYIYNRSKQVLVKLFLRCNFYKQKSKNSYI